MSRDSNTAQDLSTIEASKAHRLIGWLVSYGLDSNGAAFEIRSGRIFISSAALLPAGQNGNSNKDQQRCIIINDKSVSALHLALLATNSHQVFIQDVFSERGTFVTKAGESEEQKITGMCEIKHGDWIRLGGDKRFQVCLIDGRRN